MLHNRPVLWSLWPQPPKPACLEPVPMRREASRMRVPHPAAREEPTLMEREMCSCSKDPAQPKVNFKNLCITLIWPSISTVQPTGKSTDSTNCILYSNSYLLKNCVSGPTQFILMVLKGQLHASPSVRVWMDTGGFRVLAVVNSAAVNAEVHISL